MKRIWKRINDEQLKKYNSFGLTSREIAKLLNASQSGISRALQRLDLSPAFPKDDEERKPRTIYDEAKDCALSWKNRNLARVRKMFSLWQKKNRKKRNKYQRDWSKKK